MSEAEVTEYFESQTEPTRSTLLKMRKLLLEIEPNLEQVIAWKSAMFKMHGNFVVGLCAHKAHISFSPQSAEVMHSLADELSGYVTSKNSFQFAMDEVLDRNLVEQLLNARLAEIA